jgi:hypothetical protein
VEWWWSGGDGDVAFRSEVRGEARGVGTHSLNRAVVARFRARRAKRRWEIVGRGGGVVLEWW